MCIQLLFQWLSEIISWLFFFMNSGASAFRPASFAAAKAIQTF